MSLRTKGFQETVGQVCATRNDERCLIVVGELLASENNLLSVDAVYYQQSAVPVLGLDDRCHT